MAGSHASRTRRGGSVARLAVLFLALAALARAQGPGPRGPAPPRDLASVVDAVEPTVDPLLPRPLFPAGSFLPPIMLHAMRVKSKPAVACTN